MKLARWTQQRSDWLRQRKLQVLGTLFVAPITVAVIVAVFVPSQRGWVGFWADNAKTTTVEKDAQGNKIKTVETTREEPGKTLWDWMSLLGVPLSLAVLGYWLQQQQQHRIEDEAKEEALQVYIDRVSALLIDKNLLAATTTIALATEKGGGQIQDPTVAAEREILDAAIDVIRARTLSILRRFRTDSERKISVFRFLVETEIIGKLKLQLSSADLSRVNLSGMWLEGIDLRGVNLSEADLSGASLSEANLSNAELNGANLSSITLLEADLSQANLTMAILIEANLAGIRLIQSNLNKADLSGAILCGSVLWGANLSKANLRGANLAGADLGGADLSGADLTGAILYRSDLKGITSDPQTIWPEPEDAIEISEIKNIPDDLKEKLGPG